MKETNPFKPKLPPPKEKALQLKRDFGDSALDVIREIYMFGSEELMYLNKVESELSYSELEIFMRRMDKLGISITLSSNLPWLYIDSICGKKVKKK